MKELKNIKIEIGWLLDKWYLIPTIELNFKLKSHSIMFLKFTIDFNY